MTSSLCAVRTRLRPQRGVAMRVPEPGAATGDPQGPPSPPRVRVPRGSLVWSAGGARGLRERLRLWGALIGTPPRGGRGGGGARRGGGGAGGGARLPLLLRPEEERTLRESLGNEEQVEEDEAETEPEGTPPAPPCPSPLERRCRVFRELWGRGLHLTPGGKFGGDFLVYPGPPPLFHALGVVQAPPHAPPLPVGSLVASARLGTHVRKTLLLCSAPPGGALALTSVTWRGDLT